MAGRNDPSGYHREAIGETVRPGAGPIGVLLALMLVLVFAFSLSWIWIVVDMNVQSPESVMTTSFLFLFPLTFVSNIFVDPATMPGWLQVVVRVKTGHTSGDGVARVHARRHQARRRLVGARGISGHRDDLRTAGAPHIPKGAVV